MIGKWHLGYYDKSMLPENRGFDEFTGILTGQASHTSYKTCVGVPGSKSEDDRLDYGKKKDGNRFWKIFDFSKKAEIEISTYA